MKSWRNTMRCSTAEFIQVNQVNDALSERNDNIYREIYEAEPVPDSLLQGYPKWFHQSIRNSLPLDGTTNLL